MKKLKKDKVTPKLKFFPSKAYPWVVISLSAIFLFYKHALQVSPSVMTNDLMVFFHIDAAAMGNLAATFFYAYLIVQLFAGPLLDKFSPRILTVFAISLSACGALIFSKSHVLFYAGLGRGLIGAGVAFATVSYMKMAAIWFRPNQFALISGLLATAAMMGALFGEAPLAYLVQNVGWQKSIYYCALFGFVIAALFFFIVKDKPVSQGLSKEPQVVDWRNFLVILKSRKNWVLTFYSGLAFTPLAVFGGLWGTPFLQAAYQVDKTQAASLVSCSFLGLAFGGPLLGVFSEWIENRLLAMAAGTLLSFISICIVLYSQHESFFGLSIWLFLFGFGTGSFMLCFAMGKELNHAAMAGTVIGLINTGDGIFGSFTEPLTGKFLDLSWGGKIVNGVHYFAAQDYRYALSILPLYLFVAVGLVWFLRKK